MTALLYVLLAIVISVAIWQITSILNLKGTIATEKDNNTQGILFVAFGIFFYGFTRVEIGKEVNSGSSY